MKKISEIYHSKRIANCKTRHSIFPLLLKKIRNTSLFGYIHMYVNTQKRVWKIHIKLSQESLLRREEGVFKGLYLLYALTSVLFEFLTTHINL